MANILRFQVYGFPSEVTEEQLRKAFLTKYSGEIVSVRVDRLSEEAIVELLGGLSVAEPSGLLRVKYSDLLS
ncbi:hypothetical protein EMIT0P2_100092 [Pseudomonas sp. IT-P2]